MKKEGKKSASRVGAREKRTTTSDREKETGDEHYTAAFTWRDERNSIPQLTINRTSELVNIILRHDEDEEAEALIELITGFAYERDHLLRDNLAFWAAREAFISTSKFSNVLTKYADKVASRVETQPSK
jgi:hypothetical protein